MKFKVGGDPFAVAVGDFNGAGRQDLAVANSDSQNVSILLGNGDGSFGAAVNFPVGQNPVSIAVGDFNADGKQDLVVTCSGSGDVWVLLGDGTGSFSPAAKLAAGSRPRSVAVGDFNGDGKQDLAVANILSNDVSVLLGDGAGGFSLSVTLPVGQNPTSVAVADLDGDGKQDLIVANASSNSVSVFLGNGAGGFGPAMSFPAGGAPTSVAVGDFNSDGRLDLAFANYSGGAASVLLGQCKTPPSFSIDSVAHNEGDAGTTSYVFTVTKNGSTTLSASVDVRTQDGTATLAENDYQANSGTLTFAPADTTQTITVLANGDTTFEQDETFTVHLSNATNATIAVADGTGTITNDDAAPSFSIDNVMHNEGDAGTTSYVFTVTKNGSTTLSASVDFRTQDGTATLADNDYQANSSTLTFAPTDTTKTITVLGNGDTTFELDETFTVHLSNATNAPIAAADGTGTITNDDAAPSFSIDNVTHNEGDAGPTAYVFTVTKTGATVLSASVSFATQDGTATLADNDYQPNSGTLTFAPTETSKTITVLVNGDTVVEPDETFIVHLSNATNATISIADGTGTIVNDDVPPPCVAIFSENFDSVSAPALPGGWTTAATGTEVAWVTSSTTHASAPNDAFAPEANNKGNTELVTPTIMLPSGAWTLTFQNLFNMQATTTTGFDGMVLEISVDGSPFADILVAGGSFATGGYTHTISKGFGNPIGGRMAWSGLSGGTTDAPGYITTTVNLPAAANGQNIQLKWRVGTDNSAVAAGVPGVRI